MILPMLIGIGGGLLGAVWLLGILSSLLPHLGALGLGMGLEVSAGLLALGLFVASIAAYRQAHSTDILSELKEV